MHEAERAERPLSVESIETIPLELPMRFPLGTSATTVRTAPLLLCTLRTREGADGRAYLFCYSIAAMRALDLLLHDAAGFIAQRPLTPRQAAAELARRATLVGVTGLVRMALSAIDIALWDALAVAAGRPLAALLGGTRTAVPAYNSSGLGLMAPHAAADEAARLLTHGFGTLKVRLGHPTLDEDLAVLHAIRERVPGTGLLADYNQALTVEDALRRGLALQDEGIAWLEEPIRHDDLAGNSRLADALDVPIQLGENFNRPEELAEAVDRGACDLVMPDVARIGGVSGWLRAAALAAARGTPISSHLFPEISVHLLAAGPTAHWLEYVDWAGPLLRHPLQIRDSQAIVPDRPGIGLEWDPDRVAFHRYDRRH
ncbi:mandelate racemase [Nonomuraea sp. FMUSA5-5]|uniref:Mandelate racemase n=1 Tax=Nonomuraea composti TaxID=2720023 RepID=A0ABX1BDB0_9ACTN|nr:enolase C-terminal domain-like protein [Nonomuraea sp. FMUSA5-5]NJP94802.1 mandelate racemase [Nonomuraea sp. FMUSA5-5]